MYSIKQLLHRLHGTIRIAEHRQGNTQYKEYVKYYDSNFEDALFPTSCSRKSKCTVGFLLKHSTPVVAS